MTTVTERFEASGPLTPPPAAATGDYINSLRDNAGFLLGKVDWVAEKIFHMSPIKEFVQPMTGDWTKLEVAAGGWERMGAALGATADNVLGGVEDLPKVWEGEAAAAAAHRMLDVADLHATQAEGCRVIAEQCRAIIDVSQAVGEMIAVGLSVINDILMQLAAELAVPVFGWAAGAILGPGQAVKFYKTANRITRGLEQIVKVINLAIRVIGTLQKMVAVAQKAMSMVTRSAQTDSGLLVDDTARVQFGVG